MNSSYRKLRDQSSQLPPLSPICRDTMFDFDVESELSGSKCSTRLETSKTSFSSTLNSTEKGSSRGCRCSGTSFRTAFKTLNIPPTTQKSSTTCFTSLSGYQKSDSALMSMSSPISTSSPINYSNSKSYDSNRMSTSKVNVICSKLNASENSNRYSSNSMKSFGNGKNSFACGSTSSYSSSRKSSIKSDSSCSKSSFTCPKTREPSMLSLANKNTNSSSVNDLIKKVSFICAETSTGYDKTLSNSSSSCSKSNNNTSRKNISNLKSPCIKSTCSKVNSFRSKLYATCQSSNGLSICASMVSTAINATINSSAHSNESSSYESESDSSGRPMGSLFSKLLDNAGLGKYKTLFEKENIDALCFTLLKPADFERLGITDPEDLRRLVGLIKIIIQFFYQRAPQNYC